MYSGVSKLISAIKERIDAQRLVEAIGFHTDKMRVIGKNIKTPCMIHGDERFATLIIDPSRHHFMCMVGTCPAREGGDLLRLYELWSGERGLSAALSLAEFLGIEVDQADVDEALRELRFTARSSSDDGRWGEAAAALLQIERIDPASDGTSKALTTVESAVVQLDEVEMRSEAAALCAEAASVWKDSAPSTLFTALQQYYEGRTKECGESLANLSENLSSCPQDVVSITARFFLSHINESVLLEAACEFSIQSAELESNTDCGYLLDGLARCNNLPAGHGESLCAILIASGRALKARDLATRILRSGKGETEKLLQFGSATHDALKEAGIEDVYEFCKSANELAEKENCPETAADWLELAAAHVHAEHDLLAQLAKSRQNTDQTDEAVALWRRAAEVAAEKDDQETADQYYQRAREIAPDDHETSGSYLDFLESCGNRQKAAQLALDFSRHLLEDGDTDSAAETALRATRLDEETPELRRGAAEVLYRAGRTNEASCVLIATAEAIESKASPREAAASLVVALEHDRSNPEIWRHLGRLHAKDERLPDALREYAEAADLYLAGENYDEALVCAAEAVEAAPADLKALSLRANLLKQSPSIDTDQVVTALLELMTMADTANDPEVALSSAESLLEIDESNEQALEYLAREYERQNKNFESGECAASLAKALSARKQNEEAILWAEKAHHLLGNSPKILELLTNLLKDVGDEEGFLTNARILRRMMRTQQHDLEKAIEISREIVAAASATADDFRAMSEIQAEAGDVEAAAAYAIEGARKAFEQENEKDCRDLLALANSHGIQSAALQHEAGLLRIKIGDTHAGSATLCRAAVALAESNRSDDARSCLEEARKAGGLTGDAVLLLGELLVEAGEEVRAAKILREAHESVLLDSDQESAVLSQLCQLLPDDSKLQARHAELLAERGDRDQSLLAYMNLTRTAIEAADYPEALPHILAARELAPDDIEIRKTLAKIQSGLGNDRNALSEYVAVASLLKGQHKPEEALETLEEALAIDSDDPEALALLVDVHEITGATEDAALNAMILAEKAETDQRVEDALRWFRRAHDLTPEDDEIRDRIVELLASSGHSEDAALLRLEAVREKAEAGLIEEALTALDGLVEMEEDSWHMRRAAGRLFEEAGIPELAAAQHLKAGRSALEQDQTDRALEAATAAHELNPRSIESAELVADINARLGESDKAIAVLATLASRLAEAGLAEKALESVGKIRALGSIPEDLLFVEADQFQALGRTKEAAEALKHAGSVQEQAGRHDEALQTYRRILELSPDDTQIRRLVIDQSSRAGEPQDTVFHFLQLAESQARSGRNEEALETLQQALESEPQNIELLQKTVEAALKSENDSLATSLSVRLARLLLEFESGDKAQESLEQVRKQGAKSPEWHETMAAVARAANSAGMAMREYEEAASLYEEENNPEAKGRVLRFIVEIDPQNPDPRRELVDALRKSENHGLADRARLELGQLYQGRGLHDLAEMEYRALTEESPQFTEAWQALFENHEKLGDEKELIPDFIRLGRILNEGGQPADALDVLARAIRADPRSIAARESYIEIYRTTGEESDLCEDYLYLADLYVSEGEVDKGINLYSHVMALNPEHQEARDRLSETQARAKKSGSVPARRVPTPPAVPNHEERSAQWRRRAESLKQEDRDTVASEEGGNDSPGPLQGNRATAARLLAAEMLESEEQDNIEALEEILRSYDDILAINPNNAGVHVKSAQILEQLNRDDQSVEHLSRAMEIYFEKSDLQTCIDLCEQILRLRPANQQARLRLRQALNKRDAFKALESEILFADADTADGKDSGRETH